MYTWKYVDEGRGLELFGSDVVTGAEIQRVNREILTEGERLRVVRFSLVVFDTPATLSLTTGEIRAIVEQDREMAKLMPDLSLAVVAGTDIQFGLSRMWESYAASVHWRTAVFRTRDEAEAWLFLPDDR